MLAVRMLLRGKVHNQHSISEKYVTRPMVTSRLMTMLDRALKTIRLYKVSWTIIRLELSSARASSRGNNSLRRVASWTQLSKLKRSSSLRRPTRRTQTGVKILAMATSKAMSRKAFSGRVNAPFWRKSTWTRRRKRAFQRPAHTNFLKIRNSLSATQPNPRRIQFTPMLLSGKLCRHQPYVTRIPNNWPKWSNHAYSHLRYKKLKKDQKLVEKLRKTLRLTWAAMMSRKVRSTVRLRQNHKSGTQVL